MNSQTARPKLVDEDEPPLKSKTMRSAQLSEDCLSNGRTDFIIISHGCKYPVHSSVLIEHSDYFKALLEGTTCMRESQMNQVCLEGIDEMAIKAVIDFIYTGRVEISPGNLDDLLNASSHLQIASLIDRCSSWLTSSFDLEHYETLAELATKYCLTQALESFTRQLAEHFLDLTRQSSLYLGLELLQLIDIVSQDCLAVGSEYELLSLLETWLSHKKEDFEIDHNMVEEQEAMAVRLLSNVRFGLMSLDALQELQHRSHYPPAITSLITSALRSHENFPSVKPNDSTVQNRIRSREPSLVIVLASSGNKKHEILACRQKAGVTEMYSLYTDAVQHKTCGAVTIDNCLYTISLEHYGGFDHDAFIRLKCFNPAIGDQRPLACPELQVIPAGIAAVGKAIYACGGVSKCQTSFTNLCEAFDVERLEWQRVPSLPAAVGNSAIASLNDRLYLSGGQRIEETGRVITGQFFSLKPGETDWKELASLTLARRGHSMLAVGSKAIIVSGGLINPSSRSSTGVPMERYDVITDQWTIIKGCSTLRGPSLGHFYLLPGDSNTLFALGHEQQRAQEHEIWSIDLSKTESLSADTRLRMTLPEKYKLHEAFASHLYLNFNDKSLLKKRCH
ncbi:kelch-like protein 2 [Watersipora subatra]|uniref:kelch-like protein 2 n=1 Tax=Watersipora subatra TaxID=2589382 RepID=UPI00355AF6FD